MYGVVEATTFPALSCESKVEGLTLARFKIVPASKVRVPDVKLSEVSERRNDKESIPSKVCASPPPPAEIQFPFVSAKHPAVNLIPLLKVEVAPDVSCSAPPEITIPEEVALNPGAIKPEYKVEVPDWKLPTDWTERIEPGVEVPIPTLPVGSIFITDVPSPTVLVSNDIPKAPPASNLKSPPSFLISDPLLIIKSIPFKLTAVFAILILPPPPVTK